jgi:uncharacterized phage-associated protein
MDISRAQQAALYFATNANDLYLVKLMKLFYYLDFISVRETGKSVTNDVYFHLPYGPIPSFIKDNIDSLDSNVKKEEAKMLDPNQAGTPLWLQISSVFDGILELHTQGKGKIASSVKGQVFDGNKISEYEKGLLADIVKDLGKKTVQEIVTMTHAEPPYAQTSPSQVIPYDLAFQHDVGKILPSRVVSFDKEIAFSRFVSS